VDLGAGAGLHETVDNDAIVAADAPLDDAQIVGGELAERHVFDPRGVLIVDDDVRNVFALASVLENYGMEVVYGENGREGLAKLEEHPDIDLVLMDVMMPELDGHETTRAVREQERFKRLPIIALTAKAMKGDREKSIKAGASDYITKLVDTDQLLSLMRVWLYQ